MTGSNLLPPNSNVKYEMSFTPFQVQTLLHAQNDKGIESVVDYWGMFQSIKPIEPCVDTQKPFYVFELICKEGDWKLPTYFWIGWSLLGINWPWEWWFGGKVRTERVTPTEAPIIPTNSKAPNIPTIFLSDSKKGVW